MANKTLKQVNNGLICLEAFIKICSICFIIWVKTRVLSASITWAVPSLLPYMPDASEETFAILHLQNYANPVFLLAVLWTLSHVFNEKYGGTDFYYSGFCFAAFTYVIPGYVANYTETSVWQWVWSLFLFAGFVVYIRGLFASLKNLFLNIFYILFYVFCYTPMKVVGFLSPSLYDFMVKKVWWRLDANDKFYPRKYTPKDGEVDPRDGNTFYQSSEWRKLRYKAFEMYGTVCMDPSCNNPATHVDHVKPRSLRPDLALNLNNLQVLCSSCNKQKSNKSEVDFRPAHLKKN